MAEAVRWGKRGARVNTISPGIIMTPLAKDELTGPRGEGYRRMIEVSAAGRAGTPDEVGTVGALLMGPDGGFITGSDFLMDGGVTAAYWYGELAPRLTAHPTLLGGNHESHRRRAAEPRRVVRPDHGVEPRPAPIRSSSRSSTTSAFDDVEMHGDLEVHLRPLTELACSGSAPAPWPSSRR